MVSRKKHTFRSERREVRLYRKHFIASGLVAVCVFVVGVGVWYGTRRPEVTLRTIAIEGGTTVSHEVVRDKVESILAGTYALLIPHRFAFMFPETQIANAINTIPRVHNAVVERTSRTELSVRFEEYMPYALWCDFIALDASTTPSCIFVDAQGFAYADAPPLLGETLLRFVVEGKKPEKGTSIYNANTLAHYRSFSDAIAQNHKHRLSAITETTDGDLILHLSGDVRVLITKDSAIETVFENIESIFQAEEFKEKPLEGFEYIDLRFGNRVYIKPRGAGEEASSTPPEIVPVVIEEPQEAASSTTVPDTVPDGTVSTGTRG